MTALLDNTVMSNFSTVQRPDLVQTLLGGAVATTEQAFAELQTGIVAFPRFGGQRNTRPTINCATSSMPVKLLVWP